MAPESFLVDRMYHADRFVNVEPCLRPMYESHLVMMGDPFNVLLGSISQDLVEDFGVHIHQGNWSVILLFDGVFAWFWDRVMLVSQNEFGSFPSVAIF